MGVTHVKVVWKKKKKFAFFSATPVTHNLFEFYFRTKMKHIISSGKPKINQINHQ